LIGERTSFSAADILVNADYLGGGYGVMGAGEQEAVHLFARQEGMLLDPVYTGRVAAGLIDLVRQGFFSPNETVLFWHTGGTPAIFSDRYREMLSKG
jgi:1-aminocyclopropane-1-carboxylate deaminase/D-cysteine desulfhydrase-like pyridoxal-dependent ACC family enzyme